MAASTVVRADVLWRRVADGVLIRRRGDDHLVLVTGSGEALWMALAEPLTIDALVVRLARDHDADAAIVEADVSPLVADLVEKGILLER